MKKLNLGKYCSIGLLAANGVVMADGYDFEAVYTGEVVHNVSGGISTGGRYLDNLDLLLSLDLRDVFGTGRGTVFLHGLYNNSATFADELVGDLQVTSNIDAPYGVRLFEAWYEIRQGAWSLRSGLYDLNSEFDAHETGSLFLNSSHGIGAELAQTGENGPSIFPISSLAVRAAWQNDNLSVRLAVLDGVPGDTENLSSNKVRLSGDDGALVVLEMDATVGIDTRLWAGHWKYTGSFDHLISDRRSNNNDGWYLGAERSFELTGRTASAFVRYGTANADLNSLENYFGAGVVVQAPFAWRPDDQLGIAIASAGAGDPYLDALLPPGRASGKHETIWELTYRAMVNEHLVVQPNIQFVKNPAMDATLSDALVVAIRFQLSF
ncbi:MAG: carbohydrate porin [Woeseia sp.]